jgi:DNA modification methylase
MKAYYQDKWVTIYHGDCREVLPQLDVKVDLAVTSPPYNVGIDYGDGVNDKLDDSSFRVWMRDWLAWLFPVMGESSRFYLFTGDKMMWWVKPVCEDAGWTYAQKLEWCKPNLVGGSAKISGDWNFLTESILLFRKGKRVPMLSVSAAHSWNWFIALSTQTNFGGDNHRYHPAQFPISVVSQLIARTPGDLVLDPFLGSGTTCWCAKKLNRYSIGIEIEEKYCEIAARRCSQEVMEFSS